MPARKKKTDSDIIGEVMDAFNEVNPKGAERLKKVVKKATLDSNQEPKRTFKHPNHNRKKERERLKKNALPGNLAAFEVLKAEEEAKRGIKKESPPSPVPVSLPKQKPPGPGAKEDLPQDPQQIKAAKRLINIIKARNGFLDFMRLMMPDPLDPDDVEKSRFEVGPQHILLAEVLEKAARGELRRTRTTRSCSQVRPPTLLWMNLAGR